MQTLLAKRAVSLTELREPNKVIAAAGNEPVVIMNRNVVVGYFVPIGAVANLSDCRLDANDAKELLAKCRSKLQPTLDYLRDK